MNAMQALKLGEAQQLLTQNKPEAALAQLQRLAAKVPNNPDICALMGMTLMRLGRLDQSLFYCRQAVAGAPDNPSHQANLAIALVACGKDDDARPILESILLQNPANNQARLILVNMMLQKRRAAEAMELCRQGLALAWHAQLAVSYGAALISLSDSDEAVAFLRQAIARYPDETYLAASLALAITAQYGAKPQEVFEVHRAYGRLLDRIKPAFTATYTPRKDPERRLRIGLVSPDFRQHSVAYFVEPFLERFNKDQFEVVCYYTNRAFDAVSARFKGYATLWRDASSMIEIQLARQMSEDRIDIAVDLAGHTEGNSLQAFSLRMAPVQVTYVGYPDTSGVNQMDYRIVDSYTDPAGADARAVEKLFRMDPCFLCYRPPDNAPAPARNPAFPGPVFGSFNASRKSNAPLIALWSRILKSVPSSRMALKAQDFADPAIRQRIYSRFGACGIGPERLDLLDPAQDLADHLALYGRIDIGLDPMPYNGTTTTCEAMWMGVPVATMAGAMHPGRVGVSLLNNIGAPELVAKDEDDYVRIAVELAGDPARLATYRTGLRARLASSSLCDREGFARRLETALRTMWQDYCAS